MLDLSLLEQFIFKTKKNIFIVNIQNTIQNTLHTQPNTHRTHIILQTFFKLKFTILHIYT